MLKAVGTKLYDGDTEVRLNGINDTTVLTFQMLDIFNSYPSVDWSAFRYSNHNLPEYPVPGSTYSDRDCKIPSDSWKEFWYKYFWLLRNALGGPTASTGNSKQEGHQETGTTALNHLRIGGHNDWGGNPVYSAFKNARTQCDAAMKDILDMAKANGVYLNITMIGTPPENSTFGSGDLFTIGTEAYNKYVQYCADFINAYGEHEAIAVFDLFNEPINYTKYYADGKWRSEWWVNRYGMDIVQYPGQSQSYERWEAEGIKWKQTLLGDVRNKITLDPKPLLTIGGGYYFVNYWDSQTSQDIQKNRAKDYLVNDDLINGHPYGSAEDDYLINWNKTTRDFLGKPGYEEEYGYNRTTTKPDNSYWPWRDLKNAQIANNCCVMVLNGMPNPVWPPQPDGSPDHYCWPQPTYPGYPLPTSKLDEATQAWNSFNTPSEPTCRELHPEPEVIDGYIWDCVDGVWSNTGVPYVPEPTYIIIDVPPVELGSIVTSVQSIVQPLPNIVIPAQTVNTKVRIFGKNWDITIVIPSQTIVQPSIKINIPAQTIKLPTLDIPPFEEELP